MGDVASTLNREGADIDDSQVGASQVALLELIADGTLSNRAAKQVFAAM
jgi:aspartyl-tRNA(Asn)/glutamyl-tRNA(Gln) amidotransferase subunit B